ncbi:type II toxin-antitoxin system HigB family toxin [Neolewinella sp.]|uniref:type II toxin-antitoxin system HigB family toxin n=1 Tax=Neolewinella sp. TaxID=2993543 RepID=UPI003B528AE7
MKEFGEVHPAAKVPLLHWYGIVKEAKGDSLADVRADFRTVDYVGNNRYVFDIKGNAYRLIVIIIFASRKVYIRFIGTHAAYDKVDAKTI